MSNRPNANYKPKGFGIKSGWKDSVGHVWENDDEKIQIRDRDRYGLNGSTEPANRSALNRMFDMLQVGQYVVQGGIHGAISDETTVMGDMYEGLKAGNPFGKGNEKGEFTTSQNLGDLGWNPESIGGKIAKGTVGFIGDVLLDPLTYVNPLSVGGTAVFKGTGQKVGKEVVEKFSKEMAEKTLRQTGGGVIPEAKAVEDLVRRVNKSRGIVEEGSGKGFGLYGDNIPFAKQLGLAGKKSEWVSETSLRAFGDATIAPYMNKISDKLIHSKVGKLFSTKGDLLDMARKDPTGLAMGFEFATKAGKANLTYKEALVNLKDDYAKIKALDPESQKLITKILEDPKLWEKATTHAPFMAIKEAKDLHAQIENFVKMYGMEDKNMQKVMSEIIPKFKSGEKVTMRFPGMKDHNVIIEGMTGIDKQGIKHYKIKGYDKNIPETAFLSAKETSSERLTSAYGKHMENVKKSVDAGDTGRINLSNDTIGIDANGVPLSQELDDMIENGVIPITKGRKNGTKNSPYKDYKTNPNDYVSDVAVDKIDDNIADYESKWLDDNIKTDNPEVNHGIAQGLHESKKNPTVKMSNDEWKAMPKVQAEEALTKSRNSVIKSQSDIKWKEKGVNDLDDSINTQQEFKRFITDKIRINDNGDVVNNGVKIGTARTMNKNTSLVSITGNKSVGKKAWESYNKTEGTRRAFFEHLLEKDPAVKEMFQGLIDTDMLVMKDVNIKAFVKSYLNDPYHKPADMVHLFHKDHDVVVRLLERKYGKYEKLIERNEINKALNKAKTSWDGEGLAPLPSGLLKERMSDMYKIMNDPELIKRAEKTFGIQDANSHLRSNKLDNDPTGLLKSEKNNAITADERFAKQQADDVVDKSYVLTDELAMDRATTEKMFTVHDANGNVKAKVEALPDGVHYSYVDKEGVESIMTEQNLKNVGYTLEPVKPFEKGNSVTGTKIKEATKTGYVPYNESYESPATKAYNKQNDIYNKNLEAYKNGEESSADLFKAKEETSVSKYVDDEPLETPKTQQEINDAIINAEDDIVESVSTKSENIIDGHDFTEHYKRKEELEKTIAYQKSKGNLRNVEEYSVKLAMENRWNSPEAFARIKTDELKEAHKIINVGVDTMGDAYPPKAVEWAKKLISENKVSTKSEEMITKTTEDVAKEAEAKAVIDDKFNLGLISETVESMMGKETQGAYKTIEQALSELPDDMEKIIAQGELSKVRRAKFEQKLTDYRTALSSQAEFERFAKTLWGDTEYNRLISKHSTTIRAIDTPEWADRDVVEIAKGIKNEFKSIGEMEKAIGHLDNVLIEEYVYHAVNPMFKSPLADFTQDELDNMGIKVPKNQFEKTRQYKKGSIMPDGHVLTEGTVEEINTHILKFGEDLNKILIAKGKEPKKLEKLFQDEISDIYLARMQGHYKLMYDDAVYGDITMKFGSKYSKGQLEDGYSLTVSTKKMRNAMKKMSPEERTKVLSSYGFTEEEFNKLGDSFKRVDKDVADKIIKNGHAEVHKVSDIVLDKAEKLAHVQTAEDVNGLLGAYDKFLNVYKLAVTAYRPAFHFNNMKGNAFNNYLDVGSKAFSPKYNMSALDMVTGKNMESIIELGGKKYTYREIVNELTIQGKIGNGFFGTDIKKVLEKEVTDSSKSTFKKLMGKPTEIGSAIEDQGKLVNFMANLDLGKSFTEAGEHVDKFLFDYSDVTKFENEAMKRIFPFYTWMRKNAPLQLEQMLTNPKRYMPVAKAINNMEDMVDKNKRIDKNKVPAFARDWVQLPFNIMGDNGNEEALMWSNNLPYLDVNKIPNILSPKDSAVNIFESSSPLIKMPVELGTNYNYFFDRKIDKDAKVVDPSGKFELSPKLAYVLSQIPQYAEPRGVIRKSGIDRLVHIFDKGMASGVKSYDNKGYGGSIVGDYQVGESTNATFIGADGNEYYGDSDNM